MKMYSPFSMLFATTVVATVSLAGASAASASTDVLTESQETAIRAKMTSGGIASGTQDALIEKIEAGIAPELTQRKGTSRNRQRAHRDGRAHDRHLRRRLTKLDRDPDGLRKTDWPGTPLFDKRVPERRRLEGGVPCRHLRHHQQRDLRDRLSDELSRAGEGARHAVTDLRQRRRLLHPLREHQEGHAEQRRTGLGRALVLGERRVGHHERRLWHPSQRHHCDHLLNLTG